MAFDFIPRDAWGARKERSPGNPLEHPANFVYTMSIEGTPCHCLEECRGELRAHQMNLMVNEGLPDIRYNFIVTGNGSIYEGRGWFTEPLLPDENQNHNSLSVLIAYHGSGEYTVGTLPEEMARAARALVEHGINNKYISKYFLYFDLMGDQAFQFEKAKINERARNETLRYRSPLGDLPEEELRYK